jgi:D-3-phosphoglycerate dehydrogenase
VIASSLSDLFEKSDVVTIHVPLNAKNRNLVSREWISKMKKGAVLINTARGGLVDEDAALNALKSGALSGVGFDVFAVEPPKNYELLKHPNFYSTPHIGGSTHESVLAMGNAALDAIENARSPLEFLQFT